MTVYAITDTKKGRTGIAPTYLHTTPNFWYKFWPREVYPLSNFYKIWRGEGVQGPHHHAKFQQCGFKNVGLRPPKSPKIAIFGINLPLRKNPGGP